MIYIHFPFCRSFCTYCDFYSVREMGKMEQYKNALLREIDARRAFLMSCAEPATLYVGGGTPSLCPVEWLSEVVSVLRAAVGGFEELTVEVNPDDVTREYVLSGSQPGEHGGAVVLGCQSSVDEPQTYCCRCP